MVEMTRDDRHGVWTVVWLALVTCRLMVEGGGRLEGGGWVEEQGQVEGWGEGHGGGQRVGQVEGDTLMVNSARLLGDSYLGTSLS